MCLSVCVHSVFVCARIQSEWNNGSACVHALFHIFAIVFHLLFLQILQGASPHHLADYWRWRELETAHTVYRYNEVIFHGIQVSDNND